MSAAVQPALDALPAGPEGRDWVGLLAQGGLLTAALDGLGEVLVRRAAQPAPPRAAIETGLSRLLSLAGFRGAGAGGGGPGPMRAGLALG